MAYTTPVPYMPPTHSHQQVSTSNLGLENGMTAGYGYVNGSPGGVTSNPPLANPSGPAFDPYGGNPAVAPYRVGMMRNVTGSVPGLPAPGYAALHFLYNPNQIGVSFNFNQSTTPSMYLYGEGSSDQTSKIFSSVDPTNSGNSNDTNSNIPAFAQAQSVSWELLFDRTYDMLYSPDPGANRGVLKDVAALYTLLGAYESEGAVPVSTPIQVVFGVTDNGNIWGFSGFLTSCSVTYGIFRYDMIPSRCSVSLTMTASYVGQGVPATTPPPQQGTDPFTTPLSTTLGLPTPPSNPPKKVPPSKPSRPVKRGK